MKRLYIGGLAHTISQKDLKDRFGKFGEVSDVEIITRKDGTGIPVKTFGYININISDEALRKCITVLNKSKWKGGTLQIEIAKESFLHRLAVERQQATEKTRSPKIEHKEKLMESFTKAGVENFHMKATVPGTEIPGYKDWVVSKFGRVLPILHLKSQGKNKMFKYDPSKHSHNIRKLESTAEVPTLTPVSQLTWEILEGDDDISKKRRGEFPPQKVHPAKIRKESLPQMIKNTHSVLGKEHHNAPKKNLDANALVARNVTGHNGIISEKQNSAIKRQSKSLYVFDSEADSDDEIRMLVAQEYTRVKDVSTEDEDNLEVVGNDFTIKPNMVWASHKSKSDLAGKSWEDSDDTDEILTQSKAPTQLEMLREADKSQPRDQNLDTSCPSGTSLNECDRKPCTSKRKWTPDSEIPPKQSSASESCNEGSEESDTSDCDEATITDFHRIELSLVDLEQLAKDASMAVEEKNRDLLESDSLAVLFSKMEDSTTQPAKKGNTPEEILAAILEEDSSDESNDNDGKKKKKRKKSQSSSLPAFMGTKALSETVPGAQPGTCLKRNKHERDYERTESEKKLEHTSSDSSASEDESKRVEFKLLPFKGVDSLSLPNVEKVKQTDCLMKSTSSESIESNSDISSDGEETKDSAKDHNRQAPKGAGKMSRSAPKDGIQSMSYEALNFASTSLNAESESIEEVGKSTKQFEENTTLKKPSQKMVRTENIHQKPQQDNQKRLAALEQKQKEAEQQQKLIQGALSMLDAPVASKGKHIVFDCDDESEEEAEPPVEYYGPTKSLLEEGSEPSIDVPCEVGPGAEAKQHLRVKDFQKQACGKLFYSSEEEEEEEEKEEEDNETRFQIKPQYEGKAGQKLMQLQSRFGTDERFRMDSRFLESDEESNIPEEASSHSGVELQLQEEKKKNLDILQSLLNINVRSTEASKEAAKTKAFRDISALHYDPTRLEHAAYEKKIEEPRKESKAARRKKREEAEKLPEVSKKIYYDVATDLKEVFGPQKERAVVKPAAAWDKEEDQEKGKEKQVTVEDTFLPHTSNVSTEKAESTGFQFSFFGKDTAEDITAKDDYKTEILKKTKALWQAFGTGFRDSSSEDEEEAKEEEGTGDQSALASATEERVSAKRTFFFYLQDDERLKVGPKMFCSSAKLEDQMAHWEEKRTFLIEEYRKKHKDARRRLKTSQKS